MVRTGGSGDTCRGIVEVLGCPSGSVGGLWAEGCYAEQRHRLETVLNACIADAEDHGVRFLSVRLPEDAIAALHAVEGESGRLLLLKQFDTIEVKHQRFTSALKPRTFGRLDSIPVWAFRLSALNSRFIDILRQLPKRALRGWRFGSRDSEGTPPTGY